MSYQTWMNDISGVNGRGISFKWFCQGYCVPLPCAPDKANQ